MRAIAAPFFEQSPYLLGPVFTMVLFFFAFLGVLFYVLRSKKLKFDDVSALPLLDDTHPIPSPDGAQGTLNARDAR